jgi:hypothetical protein
MPVAEPAGPPGAWRRAVRRGWALPARFATLLLLAASLVPTAVQAWELDGTRRLMAHPRGGAPFQIGTVHFAPAEGGHIAFSLALEPARFRDHFLSMKEFKCLEDPAELACHVPYPYAHPGTVTPTDLAWLEHSLLFLYKKPSEFGARLWNGLYFQFELTPTGLKGRPQAVDLNLISAPPERPGPPYRKALRDDIAPGARWLELLTIE